MKKALLALLLLATGSAFAVDPLTIDRSSFTLSNESAYIASSTYLTRIIVSSATANAVLKIFNSTFTTVSASTIAIVDMSRVGMYDFGNTQVKGLFYVTTGNGNGVNIIYKK